MYVGNSLVRSESFPLEGREVLERLALDRVCPCQYYDLADCMDVTSGEELIAIIDGTSRCDMCGTN